MELPINLIEEKQVIESILSKIDDFTVKERLSPTELKFLSEEIEADGIFDFLKDYYINLRKLKRNSGLTDEEIETTIDENIENVYEELISTTLSEEPVEFNNNQNKSSEETPISISNQENKADENELTDEEKEVFDKIQDIVQRHIQEILPEIYQLYFELFKDESIENIERNKDNQSDEQGKLGLGLKTVGKTLIEMSDNWKRIIPCLNSKLIPSFQLNINREKILTLFNEIIKYEELYNQKLDEKKKAFNNKFNNALEKTVAEYTEIKERESEILEKLSSIISNIQKINEIDPENLKEYIKLIEKQEKTEEEKTSLKNYEQHVIKLEVDDVKLYLLVKEIDDYFDFIQQEIEENNINTEKEIQEKIIDYLNEIEILKKELYKKIEESNKLPTTSRKQYESGNTVILFLNNQYGEFLLEKDISEFSIEDQLKGIQEFDKILEFSNILEKGQWDIAKEDSKHIVRNVTETKINGKKGKDIIITSEYSNNEYNFVRLKQPGPSYYRLTCIRLDGKINEETKEKLNIPKNKPVILIIGAWPINNFNRESSDYGKMINELNDNMTDIQRIIKLFEKDNITDEELTELYKLMNDSSDLYYLIRGKAKGLGD